MHRQLVRIDWKRFVFSSVTFPEQLLGKVSALQKTLQRKYANHAPRLKGREVERGRRRSTRAISERLIHLGFVLETYRKERYTEEDREMATRTNGNRASNRSSLGGDSSVQWLQRLPPLRRGCTFKKRRDGGFRLRRRPRWGSPRYSGRHRPPTSRSRTSGLVPLSPPLQTSSQPPRIRRSYRKTNTSKLGKGEHASPQCSLLQFPNRLASAPHFSFLF